MLITYPPHLNLCRPGKGGTQGSKNRGVETYLQLYSPGLKGPLATTGLVNLSTCLLSHYGTCPLCSKALVTLLIGRAQPAFCLFLGGGGPLSTQCLVEGQTPHLLGDTHQAVAMLWARWPRRRSLRAA
jgi:hypothetical protein